MNKITIEEIKQHIITNYSDKFTIGEFGRYFLTLRDNDGISYEIDIHSSGQLYNSLLVLTENMLSIWEDAINPLTLVDEFLTHSPEYQYFLGCLQTWPSHRNTAESLSHAVLGLVSEIPETRYVNSNEELIDEQGDVQYYLVHIRQIIGVPSDTMVTERPDLFKIIGQFADVGKKITGQRKWQDKQKMRYYDAYNALQCILQDDLSEIFPNKTYEEALQEIRIYNRNKLSERHENNEIFG